MARIFTPVARVLLALTFILLLIVSAYIWLVPWIGERIAMRFSKNYEISIGEQMYRSAADTYTVDTSRTVLLNAFYRHLQYETGYPIKITVVRSDEMNAFAIPGGNIIVYDAILETMKTPGELAALLAHEASHVALRHSLRNLFRNLSRRMMLSLLLGNQSGIAAVLVNNADYLKGLQYSRKLETAADDHGLELMAEQHIDTRGMLRLMEMLQHNTSQPEPAPFLNTHPVFSRRIDHIRQKMATLPAAHDAPDSTLNRIFHQLYE